MRCGIAVSYTHLDVYKRQARNEQEHAKLWFKALHGDKVPTTAVNLEDAAAGENYEWTDRCV